MEGRNRRECRKAWGECWLTATCRLQGGAGPERANVNWREKGSASPREDFPGVAAVAATDAEECAR